MIRRSALVACFAVGLLLAGPACAQSSDDNPTEPIVWPEKMCSKGFDQPSFLLQIDGGFELHVGTKVERFYHGGSAGTGLAGMVLVPEANEDKAEVMFVTQIEMDANYNPPEVALIRVFRDRVFWPCEC